MNANTWVMIWQWSVLNKTKESKVFSGNKPLSKKIFRSNHYRSQYDFVLFDGIPIDMRVMDSLWFVCMEVEVGVHIPCKNFCRFARRWNDHKMVNNCMGKFMGKHSFVKIIQLNIDS